VAQQIKYVPIGDKIELNLGQDPEVIFELVKQRAWRDNIWMRINGADILKRVDGPGVQIEVNSTVVGWDEHNLLDLDPAVIEQARQRWAAGDWPTVPGETERIELPVR